LKKDVLPLRSSVRPSFVKKSLFRGTSIASLGLLPLFYGALFLDTEALSLWGLPLFFLSFGMIAYGMLPFKQLIDLQQNPDQLILHADNQIVYHQKGSAALTIPLSAMEQVKYLEMRTIYGVAIWLKDAPTERIIVHSPTFNFARTRTRSLCQYRCDLFLPYFTRQTFNELTQMIDSQKDN